MSALLEARQLQEWGLALGSHWIPGGQAGLQREILAQESHGKLSVTEVRVSSLWEEDAEEHTHD